MKLRLRGHRSVQNVLYHHTADLVFYGVANLYV